LKHLKYYNIFESEPSDYTIIGVYSSPGKEAALAKLREVGMQWLAGQLSSEAAWDSYFRENSKFVILQGPSGEYLTTILPGNFSKNLQNLATARYFTVDANNRRITDPEELKKITQALSNITPDDDIVSYLKANPMDQDLIDEHPRRDELIQKTGAKDISTLARAMRKGMI